MILHIVLYQPKSSATHEELLELASALESASREIPSISQVRVGKAVDCGFGYNNWPKDQESGHVAVFEFNDRHALESYLAHQEHKKLAALFWRTCDQPLIIDVSAVDPMADDVKAVFGQLTK
jgi:hypothetical protein